LFSFVCTQLLPAKSVHLDYMFQINQADSSKISVEESLHAKHGPLALARSRLQIRTSRPAQEQVRAVHRARVPVIARLSFRALRLIFRSRFVGS
jgi:hypothetical protein